MYKNIENGNRRRRSLNKNMNDGYGVLAFFGGLLLVLALALAIWALIEARHGYDPYCRANCCKPTHVHDHFEFSSDICIDSSVYDDDDDCPFKFFPIANGVLDGTDGSFSVEEGALSIDSTPFNFTVPPVGDGPTVFGGIDHVKFLAYVGDQQGAFRAYPTHSQGGCAEATELVYEGNITCQVDLDYENMPSEYASGGSPFPEEDYRMAACGFNTIAFQDFNNGVGKGAWQVADIFLTNRAIFIINERLPFGKPGFGGLLNDYAGFTQVTKVAQRKPSEYHKVAIAFNAAKQTIRYLIDDEEVYRVTRPGSYPHRCETAIHHGGESENSFPEFVSFGFGTFTILDAYHWDNGICEGSGYDPLARLDSNPDAYYDPHHWGQPFPDTLDDGDWYISEPSVPERVWGQGADMTIDYLRVYNQKCSCGA